MKKALILLSLLVAAIAAHAQVTLVKNHKPAGRIIWSDSTDLAAARLMQDFIVRISDAVIPVCNNSKTTPRKGDIVIRTSADPAVKEDGFRLSTAPGYLLIEGNDKGSIYGAVTVLERYLGCNYWSEEEYTVPRMSTIIIPQTVLIDNPGLKSRPKNLPTAIGYTPSTACFRRPSTARIIRNITPTSTANAIRAKPRNGV